ncbi:hypothetical protein [Paraliomyxa miuraensis]|uniref:hypothetical protein n=1 Tax=Paraliomyxa miuraensis TaxID=376150 RepID=UPI0022594ABD|nr:hypothetical protein [Paraliomyxa miuraensis]MCX4241259.1 hypothetical protein [Paraliomyxa miuraensis]
MTDDRRYDDREVGLILERVAELHRREGERADARSMTRAEIEQIVGELGISKALVARAAGELSVRDHRNRPQWWLGGKTDLMFEDVVDRRIDDATITRMLEVLRRLLGDPGKLEREGETRIWSTQGEGRRVHLTIVEHEGSTTVRLEESMPTEAGAVVGVSTLLGLFLGIMTMVPLKALLLKSVLMMALGPLMVLGAGTGWLVGRRLWKRHSTGRELLLRGAFGELMGLAAGGTKALPEPEEE